VEQFPHRFFIILNLRDYFSPNYYAMMLTKEFTFNEQKFIGVRKLFGEGGYYLEKEGAEKLVKFKDKIFPNVDDVVHHALEVLKTKTTK
jgi:hypothetical protein